MKCCIEKKVDVQSTSSMVARCCVFPMRVFFCALMPLWVGLERRPSTRRFGNVGGGERCIRRLARKGRGFSSSEMDKKGTPQR